MTKHILHMPESSALKQGLLEGVTWHTQMPSLRAPSRVHLPPTLLGCHRRQSRKQQSLCDEEHRHQDHPQRPSQPT